MGDIISSLKRLGVAAVFAGLGLSASMRPAGAAEWYELNFWLSGPRYDGRVAPCEQALESIANEFHEKEATYWNSALLITGFGNIHEIAFRPWQSDNIPRRYCTGKARTSDGKIRTINFSIIEDGGFAGYYNGVEWCVTGLDRNWAYNPACSVAGP